MYKDKYKEHYIAVLEALREMHDEFGINSTVHLYMNKQTKLDAIPYYEIRDILTSMEQEDMIKIKGYPRMSTLLYEDKPIKEPINNLLGATLDKHVKENFYSVVINPGRFRLVYNYYCVPRYVLKALPSDRGKYKVIKQIMETLVSAKEVETFTVAESFIKVPKEHSVSAKRRLTRDDYNSKKDKYDTLVENRLKTIRKLLKTIGYTVKRKDNMLQLAEL